jgi:pSer/pThr/pTyr-binding forkhead associated (FHA) protein
MGSFLIKVQSINPDIKKLLLKCININNVSLVFDLEVDLSDKSYFSFGRRNINNFWHDDQHMSGTHDKIYFLNNQFVIEDMGSTNG